MRARLIPDFETLLPRLVATCEAGRLVPFIGSGMSRRLCTDWPGFVGALEAAASTTGVRPPSARTPRDALVRRANSAVRTLKGREGGVFAQAVRAALVEPGNSGADLPAQTRALAGIRWPLALTTNYDNCYAAAFEDARKAQGEDPVQLSVVGRGTEDCQRVLNSLSVAGRPLLWALQGHVPNLPRPRVGCEVSPGLEEQLVVGHEEYRRATYREQHFRRAFAEVFRQRSLLFLGAGLQESYLQELFGEVLEIYGPATRPHYAFIQNGEVDPAFMLARFQIVCLEYAKGRHEVIEQQLQQLADAVRRPRAAPVAWQWGRVVQSADSAHWTSVPDFEVVRGPLPDPPDPPETNDECLAVSAGGSGRDFYFSKGIRQVLTRWKVDTLMPDQVFAPYLGRFGELPVYAVRARNERDERNLADIHAASRALFDRVAGSHRCIRMQLLASGGLDKAEDAARWKVRHYPERFSFIQTVRAWGDWRRANPTVACRLVLHVVLEPVLQDVASGRIDVTELLSCTDMRFFVELRSADDRFERRLYQTLASLRLQQLAADLQLAPARWTMRVTPPPLLQGPWQGLEQAGLRRSLLELGVLPGSTIHFQRIEAGGGDGLLGPAAGYHAA